MLKRGSKSVKTGPNVNSQHGNGVQYLSAIFGLLFAGVAVLIHDLVADHVRVLVVIVVHRGLVGLISAESHVRVLRAAGAVVEVH